MGFRFTEKMSDAAILAAVIVGVLILTLLIVVVELASVGGRS
jgi:hypothetical protein